MPASFADASALTWTPREVLRPASPSGIAPLRLAPSREAVRPAKTRSKIWELQENLHCSVIGTCLSCGELRRVLGKLGLAPPDASDHDLHAEAVRLAGRHNQAAKVLNKALDERHRLAIRRFASASCETELRTLWAAARREGNIPGAYWAVLTHPAASNALIRDVFGEVHMLSHLVGAANRADLRRLAALEAERAALETKVHKQQQQLSDAILSRDATIRSLTKLISEPQSVAPAPASTEPETVAALRHVVGTLERRLAAEQRRRETAEQRLAQARDELTGERAQAKTSRERAEALEAEVAALEKATLVARPVAASSLPEWGGWRLLYVGGRPSSIAHLKALAARLGAELLHHDGGVEDHSSLLPTRVAQADLVLFPVDCISHEAVLALKRACRQTSTPFRPLRSTGAGSLLAGLATVPPGAAARRVHEMAEPADRA
jgi:Uncharacterized protein conserved in bacteria (DUF2325)